MRSRSRSDRPRVVRLRSVRLRITTLLLVAFATLTPMWAYAMYLTVPAGVELSHVQQLHPRIGLPTDDLDSALSAERKATVVYLARPSGGRAALDGARAATDKALKQVRDGARPAAVDIGRPATQRLIGSLLDYLRPLARQRASVDDESANTAVVYAFYGSAIDGGLRVLNSLTSNDDRVIQSEGEALSRLTRSRSLLEELDARVSAATTQGRAGAADLYALTTTIGAVDGSYATAVPNLPPVTATAYRRIVDGPELGQLRDLEQRIATTRPGADLPVTTQDWTDALTPVVAQLHQLELVTAVSIGTATTPLARTILIRAGIATGFGLLGILAIVIVSARVGRGLIREMTLVRDQMEQAAIIELPQLVRRLRSGEQVDTEEIAGAVAPYRLRTRELADLNRSFDRVRRVAAESAAGEAKLRDGVSDVFVSLSRRNQALLHRQLKLLDKVERENTDPDQLEQLFALDHLATRMRRHAESLIILSGGAPGRGWNRPVPVVDLVRSAVTEVEEYTRVTVYPMPQVRVAGAAVADIIHLLAELIENATLYSPPDSPVQVRGLSAANGFAIEVEDAGLGMGEDTMAAVNAQLAEPPEFTLTDTSRLGLFVVGQLARRHGIRVSLRVSPYGGTTAIVLLPLGVLADRPVDRGRPGMDRLDAGRGAHRAEERLEPTYQPAPAPPAPAAPPLVPIRPVWAGTTGPTSTPGPAGPDGPAGAPPVPAEPPYLSMTPPPSMTPEPAMVDLPPLPENPLAVVPDAGRPQLPKRARQANLAPGLRRRDRDARFPLPEDQAEPAARSPEEARSLLTAIQQGWAGIRPDGVPLPPPSRNLPARHLPASQPPDPRPADPPPFMPPSAGAPPAEPLAVRRVPPPDSADWPAVAGWPTIATGNTGPDAPNSPTASTYPTDPADVPGQTDPTDQTGPIPRIAPAGPDAPADRTEAGE
jgi:signal transduction histidine kinase